MHGSVVDLALLALLILFFGLQQRGRPQLLFRFWFAGWIFVFLSVILWDFRLQSPRLLWVEEQLRLDSLLLGGMAFVLSFVPLDGRVRRTMGMGVLVCAPAWLAIAVNSMANPPMLVLLGLVVAGESVAIVVTLRVLPRGWKLRRITLVAGSVAAGLAMVVLFRMDTEHAIYQLILAQVFLYAAILYAVATPGSIAGLAGTLGFLMWALAYAYASMLQQRLVLAPVISQFWNFPKYFVAFGMILYIFEDSERDGRRLADRFRVLYEDFRLLYEDHPHPMWVYETTTLQVISANAAATEKYGYTQTEFLRMSMMDLYVMDELMLAPDLAAPAAPGRERPVRHKCKDGTLLTVEVTDREINFQGREARFVLAVDVTEREKLNQELIYRAHHDALTQLPNRVTLDDRIVQCITRSVRDNTRAVLFTIDADRFKLINDTYGHLSGDECLKAIAKRLQTRIRQVDTIARTGGEEFTAIIGGLKRLEDAETIAASLLRLFDAPLKLPGQDIKVTISMGGAIYPDDATDPEDLRRKSDQALYHAKRTGRNRIVFASAEVCAPFDQATDVEVSLRDALVNDGYELWYQPIFNREGKAGRFEALLRMKDKALETLKPAVFIPVAEDSGLIVAIGAWVIRESCAQLVKWRAAGAPDCSVAINLSGRQLLQRGFAGMVLETLREFGLPPEALELELTETTLMAEHDRILECMTELATAGIQFAIDDFGTGYSSLARLADLPISLLKMDRSFVVQLGKREGANGIVTAIVQMAQTMRVEVVAEGVESAEQLGLLQEIGCDHFQGFFLSKPRRAEDITRTLAGEGSLMYKDAEFTSAVR